MLFSSINFLFILNIFILFLAAYFAVTRPSYIWSLIYLIITFTAGAIHLLIIGGLDISACIYIVVCSSGMGVLLLWIVMTLNLKKENITTPFLTFQKWKILYYLLTLCLPLAFLKLIWEWSGYFDLVYLFTPTVIENYTYRELYGTNLIEFGSYLYVDDPIVVYLGGILLFFALIAAVFLTVEKRSNFLPSIKQKNMPTLILLGGGMVDTLDLGSSAFAWGFKSLPSKLLVVDFFSFGIYLVSTIFIVVGILITVAFYTLGERKVMGGIQRRKGPNVVGFHGILQPLADGLKLVLKENIIPLKADKYLFFLAPIISFVLAFSLWAFIPFSTISLVVDSSISLLCIFAISSVSIYGIILGGWASNSKYAFLGALRTTAQMISYEIVLGTIYLLIALLVGSLNFLDIMQAQTKIWFVIPLWPIVIIFIIAMLAETNRAPFDLPEAEAEIVAGYNVEYSGLAFAFYFLAEYSNMLVFSALFTIFFLGGSYSPIPVLEILFFIGKMLIVASFFIIIRAALPRLRYDQLMVKSWTILLPGVFLFFVFFFILFTIFTFTWYN